MDSPMVVRTARGVLGAVGSDIEAFAETALATIASTLSLTLPLRSPYHITLLSKEEMKSLSPEALQKIQVDMRHVHYAGVGGNRNEEVYYAVIIWAAGQQTRKQLGLPPKNFHITLSSHDNHSMDKGIDSLFPSTFPLSPTPDFFDHLAYTLHLFGQHSRANEFSKDLVLLAPELHRGFLRMADAAFLLGLKKLAMLSYACAYRRSDDDKVLRYCVKKIIECSKGTEWGPAILEVEQPQIDPDIAHLLLAPWPSALRSALSDSNTVPSLQLEPRESLFIPARAATSSQYKLPRFFRWLIPYHLAIMSTPCREEDIDALVSPHFGIRHVLTLTEETPLPESWFRGKSITNTYLPIPNYHPPSIEQMDLVISLFNDKHKLPMLIHCGGGKGRAGTVAACYLAAFGFAKPHFDQTQPAMSAAEAISLLRHIRPGSIETSHQEAFVSTWCSTIWRRQSVYPSLPSEPPPCPLIIEGSLSKEINLFILVGLPGSGKSTLRKSLLARDPSGWTAISQDESGSPALELITRLSPAINIFKFPRTAHLIDLGAASSDDIVNDATTAIPTLGAVVITEKIDGANMGFSLSSDRSKIIVQNRSHYVNSATHEQFKKLDIWVEHHRDDLFQVLDRDPYFAERYILFGEWMFATHSIPYTHLPDRFIAFDLYDRSTGAWLDRGSLSKIHSSTSISLVPVLYQGPMPSEAELRNMVQLPSKFWDGRVEGIYVKVENNSRVIARGKVVRSDFIAGNEHWSRGNLRVNGLELMSID
ncbi:hypothetical protein C0991_009609 [Blastosporella zonata]|nr:hypothetical protein C0991_009609 [Blastosporella zonata]